MALLAGCDETRSPSCTAGDFLYDDQSCRALPPDAGTTDCVQQGDLTLYRRCTTAAECCEPERPYCSVLGLFNGGDWNCNATVRVCRDRQADDCTR
jgi:hypothetical protein